jgi:hypothetical protein
MSDDDFDDKVPANKNVENIVPKESKAQSVTYISKSSKFKHNDDGDDSDDNIEITGELGNIDKEFERATKELILSSKEGKSSKNSKQNDDSDKSSSSSDSDIDTAGIWEGVGDDTIPNDVDIDKMLGHMKYRDNDDFEDAENGETQLEEISNKLNEMSTSVDNLEEMVEELNKKFDKMSRNIKKILDVMNILSGKSTEVISNKKTIVDDTDKTDPVNNTEYFIEADK